MEACQQRTGPLQLRGGTCRKSAEAVRRDQTEQDKFAFNFRIAALRRRVIASRALCMAGNTVTDTPSYGNERISVSSISSQNTIGRFAPVGWCSGPSKYLKKADALFPPTHRGGSCSWGHIPQALFRRGKAPLDFPMTILR